MKIINTLSAVNIDDNLSNEMFDKKHNEFRNITFIKILKAKKDKYMSMFRFKGDDEFTISKQKTLLNQLFLHGYAGIFDLKKAIESNLADEAKGFAQYIPSNKIALGVSPSHWDEDNNVVMGHGFTTERHNMGVKSFTVNKDNTAFVKYDEDGYNGWLKWLPYAYLQATGMTVMKKRVATMDKKLVANSANNSYENTDFDSIYSVGETFLNLSPSQNSSLSGNKTMEIDVKKLLSDKIAKLDFTAQESVTDLVSFLDQNRNMWSHMFGERVNVNQKSDRNISDEFSADEVHFALMELDMKEQMQVFADNYNKVFGKKLEVISKTDEKLDEILAQQRALSGGGADREENNE